MPLLAHGGKAIARYADVQGRRLASCLCHLVRSIGVSSIEAALDKSVLWALTRRQMEIEQTKAHQGLLIATHLQLNFPDRVAE
jgi:hypothetical protein